jgi:hypothetical protein
MRHRPGESTCQSGKSCLSNETVAAGGADAKPAPGSTPSRPASPAPRPTPGSSATTSISAGPPKGFGPVSATALAQVPVRSSPGAGEARDQPAERERPGQPGWHASRAEQPLQTFPGWAEGRPQRVDLAVPVAAPGAGPRGRLPDGFAAPRACGRPMTVLTLNPFGVRLCRPSYPFTCGPCAVAERSSEAGCCPAGTHITAYNRDAGPRSGDRRLWVTQGASSTASAGLRSRRPRAGYC